MMTFRAQRFLFPRQQTGARRGFSSFDSAATVDIVDEPRWVPITRAVIQGVRALGGPDSESLQAP